MKKKIARLMEQGQFDEQPAFDELYSIMQDRGRAYQAAKQKKIEAKNAYKEVFSQDHPTKSTVLKRLIELRKAKLMQQYHKEEYDLARYELKEWVNIFLHQKRDKNSDLPHSKKGKMLKAKQLLSLS